MSRLDHTKQDQQLVQQAFLDAFPNPDRLGCPGDQVLRAIAQKKIESDDAVRRHMRRCSNCCQELLTFQKQFRVLKIRRLTLATAAALLLITFGLIAYTIWRPRSQETAMLTFVDGGPNRATDSGVKEQIIPGRVHHLSLLLPLDTEQGTYQLQIRDSTNPEHTLLSYPADAKQNTNGNIVLLAEVDLSNIHSGHYVLAWRKTGDDNWSRGLVEITR